MLGRMLRAVQKTTSLPVFISSTDYTGASATTHTITTPSGAQSGDLLLAFFTASTVRDPMTASGWTLQYNAGPAAGTTGNVRNYCLSLLLASSPPASTVFTVPGGTASTACKMMCFRPGSSSVSSAVFSTTTQSGTTFTAPSVTATASGVLLIAYSTAASSALTLPSGFTNYSQVNQGPGNNALDVLSKTVSSGATGTFNASFGSSVSWNAGSIVLY